MLELEPMHEDVKKQVKKLPQTHGVYLFKNAQGKIIYVGKAKSLKSRVSSYFQKSLSLGLKTRMLVKNIADLEIIKTESELESLILEAELIKKYKPRYNVIYKDDKSYLYIVIRNDIVDIDGKKTKLPKILTSRKTDLKKGDVTFGPYPNATTAKRIMRTLRKIFPYRDCSGAKFGRYQKLNKPCLYGHLDLCSAPCLWGASVVDYKKEVARVRSFLSGKSSSIIKDYEKRMKEASKKREYEEAAHLRDTLKRFEYIRANFKTADKYIENPNLVEDLAECSLKDLQENIEILKDSPERIECYDISSISGQEAVGSMVVSTNGQIDKSEYKRFKVKLPPKSDDVGMMREVLGRRFSRGANSTSKASPKTKKDWDLPDLIVLDGGKGQISGVLDIMQEKGIDIPVVGIAKRHETLIYKIDGEFKEINLPEDNGGLRLIIRLRDEAHRFAQSYHHHLRLKKIKV